MCPRRGWGSLVALDDFPAIKRRGANRHVAEPGQRRPVANEPTFSAPTNSDSSDGRLHIVLLKLTLKFWDVNQYQTQRFS